MDRLEIYQKIKNCAEDLYMNHQTWTRADLADDLKNYGIKNDSFDVTILTYEAYRAYNNDAIIAEVYLDNDRNRSLVDSYKAYDYSINDHNNLAVWINNRINNNNAAFKSLKLCVDTLLKNNHETTSTNLIKTLTGTAGVDQVRTTAVDLLQQYTNTIDAYSCVRAEIKATIHDFESIREHIISICRQYAFSLIDTFGPSIQLIDPKLFDYSTISYLDEQRMLQQIKLEYDRISDSCSTIIGEISDSFKNSIHSSAIAYRKSGGGKTGMILAGLNMANHYLQATEKINILKQELKCMEVKAFHDVTNIKGDAERLKVIYKTINDLHIPKAMAYYRYADKVLKEELDRLLSSIYVTNNLKRLRDMRTTLLMKLSQLELTLNDNQTNIELYTHNIKTQNQELIKYKTQYEQIKRTKPTKPFFLWNLFSFGTLKSRYNRELYEWSLKAEPIIFAYNDIQNETKIYSERLKSQHEEQHHNKLKKDELNQQLTDINLEISLQLKDNPEAKLRLLQHLEPLLNLIRVGKQIVESRIDDKLVKATEISVDQEFKIPNELKQRIKNFTQTIQTELDNIIDESEDDEQEDNISLKESEIIDRNDNNSSKQNNTPSKNNKNTDLIKQKKQVSQQLVRTLESYCYLQALYQEGKLLQDKYIQELSRLQNEYKKDLEMIGNQSSELFQTIRQINTATNHEALKSGLLELAQIDSPQLTMDDIEQFLSGKKTLII